MATRWTHALMVQGALAAALALGGMLTGELQAQEEAVEVYQKVHTCVVALQNAEGSGTGIVLDRNGLILTNAHVIASPLPFKCTIDVLNRGKTETVTFSKVKVLGVHPEKDLALVQIDPKEHAGALQLAKLSGQKAAPGQRIYAIGNPSGGGQILNKTITSGILSGVDRVVEDVAYYQISAPINPGNSGGPLCDKEGQVVGLVTLKATDVENVGFAIPLHDLDTKQFVPWSKRQGDPVRANLLFNQAVEFFNRAQQVQRQKGAQDPQGRMYVAMSAGLMHQALLYDPGNYGMYYNIGMMLNTLGQSEVAEAYVRQALEIQPWPKTNGAHYYSVLGSALANQKKMKDAEAAWKEGLEKFGGIDGKVWEQLAVFHFNETQDFGEAAYAAAMALHLKDRETRVSTMTKLEADARAKLDGAGTRKLDVLMRKMDDSLKDRLAESQKQFRAGRRYITSEFTDYMKRAATTAEGATASVASVTPRTTSRSDSATTKPTEPDKLADLDLSIPAGSTDALKQINVDRDEVKGSWTFDGKALQSPFTRNGRIQVPTALPQEYDLTLIVERTSGQQEFVVGFVRGGVQSAFIIDANAGRNSGLDPDSTTAFADRVLYDDTPTTIVMKIRHEGLLVTADGKRIFFQRSDAAFPAVAEAWRTPDARKLFLGANVSRFTIHKLMLTPYRG